MKSVHLFFIFIYLFFNATTIFASPKIEHWTMKNGLKVYYVQAMELPMLNLRLTFNAGSTKDENKAGLALLTNAMLMNGADGLNADILAEKFESVGANVGTGSARDMAWLNLQTLTIPTSQALALDTWLKVLAKPDFPENDFQRLKKQLLVSLQAEKQSPSAIAKKTFFKYLFAGHPYASPKNGTAESIATIKNVDMQAFYKKYYVAKNGLLTIVGAVNRTQAEEMATQVATHLQSGNKAALIPVPQGLKKSQTIYIPFPSKQAHIIMGQLGSKRGDKDYFSLYLGNHVMGGSGFNSQLMQEVRVKRGLSYSVYSYFHPMRQYGPFIVGLQTKLKNKQQAIKVSRNVVRKFQQNGPTEEELQRSKKNITGGFPLRTASNANIIEYISMIAFYDLPLDYLDKFTAIINAIEKSSVADAYKRRLHPDKMLTVIVGGKENNPSEIKPKIIKVGHTDS